MAVLCGDDNALPAVKAVVTEFDRLDPTGQVFRYPVSKISKNSVPSLPTLPETLDMRHLHETMVAVANVFDDCRGAVDAIRESLAEEAA